MPTPRRPEPQPGDELTEPASGSRLRIVRTRAEGAAEMEITAPAGWNAGPLHVHPSAVERLTVTEGRLAARVGRARRVVETGGVVVVPRATPHTVEACTPVRLIVEFDPPLRTDRMFYEMYGGGARRRPPRFLPSALRAWVESRGYRAEIRYLWPRRVALAAAAGCAVAAVVLAANEKAAICGGFRKLRD